MIRHALESRDQRSGCSQHDTVFCCEDIAVGLEPLSLKKVTDMLFTVPLLEKMASPGYNG